MNNPKDSKMYNAFFKLFETLDSEQIELMDEFIFTIKEEVGLLAEEFEKLKGLTEAETQQGMMGLWADKMDREHDEIKERMGGDKNGQ